MRRGGFYFEYLDPGLAAKCIPLGAPEHPRNFNSFRVLNPAKIQRENKIKEHFSGWIDSNFNVNKLIMCFLRCWLSGLFSLSHFR